MYRGGGGGEVAGLGANESADGPFSADEFSPEVESAGRSDGACDVFALMARFSALSIAKPTGASGTTNVSVALSAGARGGETSNAFG